MKYLFTVADVIEPKIKDTDFREYYPAISLNTSWYNIRPYIRQAVRLNIIPILGRDLWTLLEQNQGAATPDATLNELTELVKQAIALYAINTGFPEINSLISDGALTQPVPDKAQNMSQWAFATARWNIILKAEKSLDIALQFILENNITWEYASKYSHPIITSSEVLETHIKVNGYRAHMAMRPYFDEALQNLNAHIGCATVKDIVDNVAAPTYAEVITALQSYVSHTALVISIPRMLTFVEGHSLIFINNAEGIKENIGPYTKANETAIKMLIDASRESADKALERIISIMRKDADTFTVYSEYLEATKNDVSVIHSTNPCGRTIGGVGFF